MTERTKKTNLKFYVACVPGARVDRFGFAKVLVVLSQDAVIRMAFRHVNVFPNLLPKSPGVDLMHFAQVGVNFQFPVGGKRALLITCRSWYNCSGVFQSKFSYIFVIWV